MAEVNSEMIRLQVEMASFLTLISTIWTFFSISENIVRALIRWYARRPLFCYHLSGLSTVVQDARANVLTSRGKAHLFAP